MPTSQNVQYATKNQRTLLRVFHLVRDESIIVENDRFRGAVSAAARILAAAVLLFTANGCLATRSWVQDQINPLTDQLGRQESRLNDTNAKLQNLRLEKRLVLADSNGPTFAFGSGALTKDAKREIDGFLQDLEGSPNSEAASGRFFVVAGYTDSVGAEDYNYELGQRRATSVAGYLVGKEGVDPTQVRVVSYGASKPAADNRTSRGRRSNRRVEILVYQEKIATGS
jgi:outer membrane protein OmpA-like peptidoglycan-associated protein